MAYSLTGMTSLGNVNSEVMRKTGGLIEIPSVAEDSDQTEVIDFTGPIRTITISGTYVNETPDNLTNFVGELEALVDGEQDSTATYVSDLSGSFSVKIKSVDYDFIGGEPSVVKYTIEMVESA